MPVGERPRIIVSRGRELPENQRGRGTRIRRALATGAILAHPEFPLRSVACTGSQRSAEVPRLGASSCSEPLVSPSRGWVLGTGHLAWTISMAPTGLTVATQKTRRETLAGAAGTSGQTVGCSESRGVQGFTRNRFALYAISRTLCDPRTARWPPLWPRAVVRTPGWSERREVAPAATPPVRADSSVEPIFKGRARSVSRRKAKVACQRLLNEVSMLGTTPFVFTCMGCDKRLVEVRVEKATLDEQTHLRKEGKKPPDLHLMLALGRGGLSKCSRGSMCPRKLRRLQRDSSALFPGPFQVTGRGGPMDRPGRSSSSSGSTAQHRSKGCRISGNWVPSERRRRV
jgi:hypothetical protein